MVLEGINVNDPLELMGAPTPLEHICEEWFTPAKKVKYMTLTKKHLFKTYTRERITEDDYTCCFKLLIVCGAKITNKCIELSNQKTKITNTKKTELQKLLKKSKK
jgi:hypothetical protein